MNCSICPRGCAVDRAEKTGYCGAAWDIKAARADLHFWEEPYISGHAGSGAIFFSGCNMRCVFCQNAPLQSGRTGRVFSAAELVQIMLDLQARGAHNINLVTPAPYAAALRKLIPLAKASGVTIPFVYNTNAYERVETLRSLDGLIDIYLPDFKYVSAALSSRFSDTPDYFEYAAPAIQEMLRQVGHMSFDETGIAARGLTVRHLVLPNCVFDTRSVLDELKKIAGSNVYLSLMRQYAPTEQCTLPPLNRKLTDREYDRAVEYAISCGYNNVTIQDRASATLDFTPSFTNLQQK